MLIQQGLRQNFKALRHFEWAKGNKEGSTYIFVEDKGFSTG
jgi:hypothetical protein